MLYEAFGIDNIPYKILPNYIEVLTLLNNFGRACPILRQ